MVNRRKSKLICLCNSITEDRIKQAIQEGVTNTDELFDKTGAGVGPCGGTCRKTTSAWIEYYKKNKKFPD